jgi:hypothetical protein
MPGDPGQQRSIMKAALELLEVLDEPGCIARLPYRWQGRI